MFYFVLGPSVAPENLHGTATSATTVRFTWDLIPILLRNGIITKYRIQYTSIEASPHVGLAEFADGAVQQGTISNLRYWTVYNFTIAARTSKGYGVDSSFVTLRTQEHGESMNTWTFFLERVLLGLVSY